MTESACQLASWPAAMFVQKNNVNPLFLNGKEGTIAYELEQAQLWPINDFEWSSYGFSLSLCLGEAGR
jgi:hypothetical protein